MGEDKPIGGVVAEAERDANQIIEEKLRSRIQDLEQASDSDVLAFFGPIYPGAGDMIKDAIEAFTQKRESILVVLETTGGFMDVAERIAIILRHHYERVAYLVPTEAMSAGTVLVMSGDSIYMDYASMLGPIDPQVQNNSGNWVPALGYLEMYERLVEKADKGTITSAELTYMVENFDPAELYRYEQERELSIALLREWLVKYKFKNWTETQTRGKTVTRTMRSRRAAEIARKLNRTGRWHSHSRGIPMSVLDQDLKLLIDDFGADPELRPAVQAYYHLLKDYNIKRGNEAMVLHTKERYRGF